MTIIERRYRTVLDLLCSDLSSLRDLAQLTDAGERLFYQGADLSGLNLERQDLRGMNFEGADFRGASLAGVVYDPGTFNGSILDDRQEALRDQYEFYYQDILDHDIGRILIFCRIRPGLVSACVEALNFSLAEFAAKASVSTNALRKARNDGVIAYDTAARIFGFLEGSHGGENRVLSVDRLLLQPAVEFLSGGINQPFKHVSRKRLQELYRMREELSSVRQELHPLSHVETWRDTPEAIESMIEYYRLLRR